MSPSEHTICVIGFDSAWTGKRGAVCALSLGLNGRAQFMPPELADFDETLECVRALTTRCDYCLLAVDQPTLVPNETGCRPVDRVAASVVSYLGGGVQPASRSKKHIFGDEAPFWRFKRALGALEDPERSRRCESGLFLIEVFPALALPALNPGFYGRLKGPKYNPINKRFRLQDWQSVAQTVRRYAQAEKLEAMEVWAREAELDESPNKADQDRLDSALCAIIGYHWLTKPRAESVMIGDLASGYMIAPNHGEMRLRLMSSGERHGVLCV